MHETQMYLTMFDVLGLFMLSILVSILLLHFVLIATQQRQGANRVFMYGIRLNILRNLADQLKNNGFMAGKLPETRR